MTFAVRNSELQARSREQGERDPEHGGGGRDEMKDRDSDKDGRRNAREL